MFKEILQLILKNKRSNTSVAVVEELTTSAETSTPRIEIEGIMTEQNIPWVAATIVFHSK